MTELVFVYGTFLRGKANQGVLERLGARFVGDARTAAPRTLVDLGPYPAMLAADEARDRTSPAAYGEAYELDATALDALDAFEGCPELYRRERVAIVLASGGAREAHTYVLARRLPADARVIASGRYEPRGVVLHASATEAALDNSPATEDGSTLAKPR